MNKRIGSSLIVLGIVMLLVSGGFVAKNLKEQEHAGESAREVFAALDMEEMMSAELEEDAGVSDKEFLIPDYMYRPAMEMPEKEVDGVSYIGAIEIPVLELELPVISTTTYPYLRISPCRLEGSAYLNNLVIGAHNYSTHFGKIDDLVYGDQIYFFDMDGNKFVYSVADIEILQPDQKEELCSGDWPLSLYTCTLGGRTRVTVRCDLVESGNREW